MRRNKKEEEGRAAESENYMDKVQDQVQEGESDAMAVGRNQVGYGADVPQEEAEAVQAEDRAQAEVDESVLDESFDVNAEPEQVKPQTVVFVPRKDFEGQVNQNKYDFKKGVPVEVPRDVANMLLEDEDRGYVRE